MSRRASSVYQGSTGGLMLQLNQTDLETKRRLEEETLVLSFMENLTLHHYYQLQLL